MKTVLLTSWSKQPPWLSALSEDLLRKVSFWIPTSIESIESPSKSRSDKSQKISIESEKMLRFLKEDDFLILCDERGKLLDSMKFSRQIESIFMGGKKRLVIIVGGAYGVNNEVQKRADLRLSLAPFTMNHHLALAVVLEQFYRAMTIQKGVKYHNA